MENFQLLAITCYSLKPIINLIRGGIWPVIQFIIPLIIIILGAVDLGKAVAGGDEKKTKEAQGAFVKRIVYGVAIFFVPLLVTLVFNMLGSDEVVDAEGKKVIDFVSCWNCYPSYTGDKCGGS